MHTMPTNRGMWDHYATLRAQDQVAEPPTTTAMEYYRENREAMDDGARPSWPERFDAGKGQISAVQYAMDILADRKEAAFMAEYQNAPMDPTAGGDVIQLAPALITRKCNGHKRGEVPVEATLLTIGIDVQASALFWGGAAWSPGFSGDVFDYGVHPKTDRSYFTLAEIVAGGHTLHAEHPGGSWEAALIAGLTYLTDWLFESDWQRKDGAPMKVEQILIDAGYGKSTDSIFKFCRRSRFSAMLLPYFGRSIPAGSTPISEWNQKPGDRVGPGWLIRKSTGRAARHIIADASAWKSHIADRILTPAGNSGCLSLFGAPADHRLLADHLSAETRTRVTANGRVSDQWKVKPNQDNHWLDCLSMSAIGASVRGIKLDDQKSLKLSTGSAQKQENKVIVPPNNVPGPVRIHPAKNRIRRNGSFSDYGI
jgi:hypothetical protein